MPIDTITSSAFLTGKWEVDIHPLGSRVGLECDDASIADEHVAMKCSSRCRARRPWASTCRKSFRGSR